MSVPGTTRSQADSGIHLLKLFPNATVQQSRAVSASLGSKLATGTSFCLGSHTFTAPSLPPVTISGAP
eukprot:1623062-Rhodomonas_salina.3